MSAQDTQLNDDILNQLRGEFLSDAEDRLNAMQALLETPGDGGAGLLQLRRDAHNLKGLGGGLGFPTVSLVAHRLEDYLSAKDRLNHNDCDDIQIFIDFLREMVLCGEDHSGEEVAELVRRLPTPNVIETPCNSPKRVETLVMAPAKPVSRFLSRELLALGHHVTLAENPWHAMQQAATIRPDLVITSVVNEGLSGIDFVRALKSMSLTRDLLIAVLTSFDRGHTQLQELPEDVPVLRVGTSLSQDLVNVITEYGIA